LPDTKGAIVAQVNPSTAAERAGVEVGDVIVSFDGKPVMNTRDLRNRVAATAVGSKVEVELIRGGEERTLEVRIGERPSAAVEAGSPRGPDGAPDRVAELGITAQTLGLCRWLGTKGVTVSHTEQEVSGHFHAQHDVPQVLAIVEELCQMLEDKFGAYPYAIVS
jgi:serine protease Do